MGGLEIYKFIELTPTLLFFCYFNMDVFEIYKFIEFKLIVLLSCYFNMGSFEIYKFIGFKPTLFCIFAILTWRRRFFHLYSNSK